MIEVKFNVIEGFEWVPQPAPASEYLPRWWKEMKSAMPPEEVAEGDFPAGTAKACSPFDEAMTAGYILPLPFQLHSTVTEDGTATLKWSTPPMQQWALVGTHGKAQLPGVTMGLEAGGIFKFQLPYYIEVPEGYGLLYTHPLNRADLPFRSFSGIVDGGYSSPVNIPFIWESADATSYLDAGLPIAQVIPFKIEEFEHRKVSVPLDEAMFDSRVATSHVQGYRKKFRKPKVWK